MLIYTSRNSFRLLNRVRGILTTSSTQVEILLGYLTILNALVTPDLHK